MALTTAMAMLAAAGIGAGASLIGSSNAADAAQANGQLQAQAAADATALNREIYNQTRADNETRRVTGDAALGAAASAFGLPTPRMTGGSGTTQTYGSSPLSPTMTGGGGIDAATYLAANPDVAAAAGTEAPLVGDLNGDGSVNATDYGLWHADHYGRTEGRNIPTMTAPSAPTDGGYVAPPGYTDPTAPNGYDPGQRPMTAPRQTYTRSDIGPADVSLSAFHVSPDYEFRVSEGNRALGSQASSAGRLMSGNRLKAAQRFGQNIADSEYTDWRAYTTGQNNYERSRADANFNSDRGYGTDVYNADLARSDGLYQDDRTNANSRYDTRNAALLTMAGFGANASNANASAAQSFAANQNAATMAGAQARGQAGVDAASAWNQGINGLMTTGAYLYGNSNGFGAPQPSYAPMQPTTTGSPYYSGTGQRGPWG